MTRIVLLLTLAAVLFSACGDDSTNESGAAAPAAESAAFPATIEHKYGSTTIEEAPKRIVVAGLREQDSLLALGVVPVATTEWYGKHPGAIFPWAEEALGDAPEPEVLSFIDGIQFEKIAAQRPDLILAVYSGITKKDYDTLSKLAPTVAQPPGQVDWGSSWQDEIMTVGRAIGKPKEAEKLRDEPGQARRRGRGAPGVQGPDRRGRDALAGRVRLRPAGRALAAARRPRLHVPGCAARHRRQGRVRRQPVRRRSSTCSTSTRSSGSPSRPGEEAPRERDLQPSGRQPRRPRHLPAGVRRAVRGDVVRQRAQHPGADRPARAQVSPPRTAIPRRRTD